MLKDQRKVQTVEAVIEERGILVQEGFDGEAEKDRGYKVIVVLKLNPSLTEHKQEANVVA